MMKLLILSQTSTPLKFGKWYVISLLHIDVGIEVNTLRPRQNGRKFPDDISKYIFLNEKVWNSIKISLKFVPNGPIDKVPALVPIMAWRQATIWINDGLCYRGIYASLDPNELIHDSERGPSM